jgi:hypothetical protein
LYEENTQLFGSQLATYKNGFYIYSAPLMIIQAVVLIAVLVYWRVYYVPKYCAVVENA